MVQSDAQTLFQNIADFISHEVREKNLQPSSFAHYTNQVFSFTLVDRFALNRLLASGYSEQQALLVSSVPHIISIDSQQNIPQCIIEQQFLIPLEDHYKISSVFIQSHQVDTFLLNLKKRLSTNQYKLRVGQNNISSF